MENVPSDGGSHREKLILQEIDRLVKERDDLRAKLNRAEMLIDRLTEENHQMVWLTERVERAEAVKESLTSALKEICFHTAYWKTVENGKGRAFAWVWQTASTALRTAEESSVVDSTPAKQPEGMTKLNKALQNIAVVRRILVENSCPSEFGLKDCECDDSCCEDCWNQEVES